MGDRSELGHGRQSARSTPLVGSAPGAELLEREHSRVHAADVLLGLLLISVAALRLPAVVLGGLFVLLIYLHARARLDPWSDFTIAVAVQLLPLVAVLGLAMTTDAPVLVCWALALIALAPAVRRGSTAAWILYGLAAAAGIGAKYTTLLLPVGLLLLTPVIACARPMLRQVRFWFGQLLALEGVVPLVVWNSRHGWVNLAHNVQHLGVGSRFDPAQLLLGPLELAGTQLLLLGPITAPLLSIAALRAVPFARRRRDPYPLFLAAAVLLAATAAVASGRQRPERSVARHCPAALLWPPFRPVGRPAADAQAGGVARTE